MNYLLAIIRDELKAYKEICLEHKILFGFIVFSIIAGLIFIDPIPGKNIQIAVSGSDSGYALIAGEQKKFLAQDGIQLTPKDTKSSIESAKLLINSNGGVNAAFIQGGVLTPELAGQIETLGSIDFEPVWIFYRKGLDGRFDRLKDLSKLRVGVGPQNSGTSIIAQKLFALNEIDAESIASFKSDSYENNMLDLLNGKLDAVINVNPAIDPIVKRLLHEPKVAIFELTHASAYDKHLPFVRMVTLPAAAIDIARQIPPKDISMLATTTNLVVNKNMHPSLQMMLLLSAKDAQRVSKNPFLSNEEKFPSYMDTSIPLSPTALQFYDFGAPQTLRYLPFWLAGFLDRTWVYLLALFAFLLPLSNLNLNLRATRFKLRIEKLERELLIYQFELMKAPIDQERKMWIAKRLDEIILQEPSNTIPTGCETEYLDFLGLLNEIRSKFA